MEKSRWKTAKGLVELLVWVAVLAFVAYRLGPQVGAALGLGAGSEELRGGTIQTLDGTSLTLEDLKGKVVLVNVWATWCPPCVIEMPGFQRVFEDYRDQGFLVLGISRDRGDPARVEAFLRKKGITYPVAMDGEANLGGITEVETLPTSFLIGRDGSIRHRVVGIYPGPTLRMAVKRLLAEESPEAGG